MSAGVFATRDGGATWAPVNRGIAGAQVFDLEIDPRQPASLYAATSAGVFATHDGGGQWTFLRPHVNELAIAAAGPPALYAAREAVIWRSTDGGATWERRGELPLGFFVHDLVVHPDDSSRVYAGTNGGVARSEDGGATWELLDDGLGDVSFVREVAFAPGRPETLYAALAREGIWQSDDGGASWSPRLQLSAPGGIDFRAVAVDPEAPDVVYAGVNLLSVSFGGTIIGEVWRSLDAGASWQRVHAGAYVHDLAVAARGGRVLAGVSGLGVVAGRRGRRLVPAHAGLRAAGVGVVAADPHRPGRLLAVAAVGGESDEGSPRLLRFAAASREWFEVPTGLAVYQAIHALAFDPERAGRVHVGADLALLLSRDDGRTWQRTVVGGAIFDLAIAPADSAVMYAAGTREVPCGIPLCGLIPQPVFARSRDGGATWTFLDAQVAGAVGRSESLEAVAADSGRASVHVAGFAVASSSDSGATWVRRNAPRGGFADLAVEAGSPPVLYGAARFPNTAAVWISRDRGLSWSPAAQGLPPGALARRLTVDPESPGRLFAGTTDGVFVSADGGRRWQRLGFALAGRAVTAVDYDAATRTLYAGIGSGPGLFAYTFP